MATLGQTLREARENKGITASQAAAATRIKVQHIEAIEEDEFGGIAAPTYAKGFIKLYAEFLELDPRPLIQEYMEQHAPKERPSLVTEPAGRKRRQDLSKRLNRFVNWAKRLPKDRVRQTTLAVAFLALLAIVLSGTSRCARWQPREVTVTPALDAAAATEILQAPPEPYLESSR